VIDAFGKKLMELPGTVSELDIPHLENGLYQLILVCKNLNYTYKFVKQ
jgi:hypothetical protein